MTTIHEMRDLANQAQAEQQIVSGNEEAQAYLDGVEEALRWAAGDGTATDLACLIERMALGLVGA